METDRVTISGDVKRQRIAAGSKSDRVGVVLDDGQGRIRSEEHTSELQSLV